MKKKFSIVIGLALLIIACNSCEPEDQISSHKPVDPSISIDKNSIVQHDPVEITLNEIENESCGEVQKHMLYAGQHLEAGTVLISNDAAYLYVTYDVTGSDWWLRETHLFAGDIDDAPFTNSGNPKFGNFPYHGDHDLVQEYTFKIPLDQMEADVAIIAHSVVVQKSGAQETAIGYGDIEFEGSRWGWIISYEQQDCEEFGSNGGASGDSETDENGDSISGTNEDGCMDAYVYSNATHSTCILNDFDTWGWTNSVPYHDNFYSPGGVTYTYPLYASAFQCDIDNSIMIGEVQINISGGDSILYGDITINLTHPGMSITDLDIYAGKDPYPTDADHNPSISFDDFDVSLDNLLVKTYKVTWLDWFDTTSFIIHLKACPDELVP